MRTLYRTPEFDEFYEALDERVKTKYCSPQITQIMVKQNWFAKNFPM